ncbi:MAG TPA: GNAT family N-acetyltransferase [bacterium]|nr:GNAT family N-acetyltransferase [bacterium]
MPGPIVIVAPDPCWPQWFNEESVLVRAALGKSLLGLEHVGSTSVPGLGAKPTIDMAAGLTGRDEAEAVLPALAQIGYHDVSPETDDADWYYCIGKTSGSGRHFHLHLVRHESGCWCRRIAFRDFLRGDAAAAGEYFELKKSLAARFPEERIKYCVAKTAFVQWVEVQAAGVDITQMVESDIAAIARAFERWNKTVQQYEQYYVQQQRGERDVLVAKLAGAVVGYTTLLISSGYLPFREQRIPEIADLNVIGEHRRRGIGSALIYAAERLARLRGCSAVGIGVEQSPEYAPASRLYPQLGFEPDGCGITASDNELHLLMPLR